MTHRRSIVTCSIVALLLPIAASAQTVRGVVADAGDQPVPGVVVLLVDSTSRVAARAVSDARGEFRVTADRAGTYRLRTLRIGYRPSVSEPVVLRPGGEVTQRLALTGVPVALDAMRVVDRSECRAFSDSGAAFAVWEQIRIALTAAQVAEASRAIASTTVAYERTLDPGGGRVLRQKSSVSTDFAPRVWRTPPPDTLRRAGYVVTQRDNTVEYYAPGLDALLSSVFVEDHCFRLTDDRKQPALVGLTFEPTPERRKGVAEIRGTLWVDRASSELRRLELRYVNVSPAQEERAGGDLEFVRMRDGTWAVSRWSIHMPVVEQFVIPGHGAEDRVTSIQVSGGELALARRGADTLWSQPARSLAGVVLDSASGRPMGSARVEFAGTGLEATSDDRGRFTVGGILPGEYRVDVHTPSLDSLNSVFPSRLTVTDATERVQLRVPTAAQLVATICGSAESGATGIVLGRVIMASDSSTTPSLAGARVTVEWAVDSGRVRRVEARAARDGSFRLCRLPVNTALALRAAADSAQSAEPSVVRLSPGSRLARTQLRLESAAQLALRGAVFTGVVVFDSTRAPIIGAEVAVPDLAKSVLTDATGSFRLTGIPAGEHQIVVRRMGYGAADTRLTFRGNETLERRIVLGRAIVLEPVVVAEHSVDRAMASFEENRRIGLGHFMTRAQLAKLEGVSLGSILEQLPGATIIRGNGGAWVRSSRSFGFAAIPPDPFDAFQGAPPAACYSQVYLDNTLVFAGRVEEEPGSRGGSGQKHWEPLFNLNSINPAQIEAIEFYASPAETPLKYSGMESHCGVVVIWTRRTP